MKTPLPKLSRLLRTFDRQILRITFATVLAIHCIHFIWSCFSPSATSVTPATTNVWISVLESPTLVRLPLPDGKPRSAWLLPGGLICIELENEATSTFVFCWRVAPDKAITQDGILMCLNAIAMIQGTRQRQRRVIAVTNGSLTPDARSLAIGAQIEVREDADLQHIEPETTPVNNPTYKSTPLIESTH